ncbi:LysR family transcriptional regulator [Aeromonas sp. 11P]|uniref:LysR family transcriptional regulator n=1 Tax=Aeromonas sp. 11P TaxID=3452713 RepID=UPI003F792302
MVNPLWLHTLVVVHETGSFTRAAERLDLTQAAEQLRARLSDDDPHRGAITLTTPGSIGLLLYPLLLDQQQEHPGLTIQHRFAPTPDIVQAVLAGRSDLGLVDQPPEHPSIAAEPFAREPLCLVVPNDGEDPSWQHLCQLGFIDHPDGRSMARRLLGRRYPGQRVDEIPLRGFTNQIGLILEPVARGLGFTVLPRFAVTAFAQQEKIRVIQSRIEVIDTLWLIYRAEWPLPARHQRLVAVLKQRVAAH